MSHTVTELSADTNATSFPSGEKQANVIEELLTVNVRKHTPETVSQIFIMPSLDTDAICLPSGENTTFSMGLSWPLSDRTHSPDSLV